MRSMREEERTPLGDLIEKRPRSVKVIDVSGFLDVDGSEITKIAFRVPVSFEQNRALANAHLEIKRSSNGNESLGQDPDFTNNIKLCEIAHAICRRPEQNKQTGEWRYVNPSFPCPDWMHKNLTPDQIDMLIRIGNAVRLELGPQESKVGEEAVEQVRLACVAVRDSDQIHAIMATLTRESLEHVAIMLSLRLEDALDKLRCLDATHKEDGQLGGSGSGSDTIPSVIAEAGQSDSG